MISDNKKFIFIHIPKNGGTSIQEMLLDYLNCSYEYNNDIGLIKFKDEYGTKKHSSLLKITKAIGRKNIRKYYKFTVVRNPYDRFISMYFWALKYKYRINQSIQEVLMRNDKINYNYAKEIISMDFARPQTRWLKVCNKIKIDYIIRLENIQDGWNYVCNKINIPNSVVPKLNSNKHGYYGKYYYNELKELIDNFYSEDFTNFYYEKRI